MTPQKIFLIIFMFLLSLTVVWYIFGCPGRDYCPFTRPPEESIPKVILTFVGPADDASDWNEIFEKFNAYKKKQENGFLDVVIKYERLCNPICNSEDYAEMVKESQYEDIGPNIFMISSNWIPKYKNKILPAPVGMMSMNEFENTFARVAKDDLTDEEGNIYALPFYIDTLALYYNEDAFLNKELISPPKDWNEFTNYVEKLTVLDEYGNLLMSGAAFGGGSNVNESPDILILLAMQNNINSGMMENLASFNSNGSIAAINFYTDFTNPQRRYYTWNEDQIFSIDAFVQKKAAMMINYSHHIENVTAKASGVLNFKIAPVPQLNKNNKVNYANYWVPVVSKKAPCGKKEKTSANCYALSWEFLNFAAKKENARLYLDRVKKPAANLALAKEQFTDFNDQRSVFAGQVFTTKNWHHPDNELSNRILIRMIDSIITNNENLKKSVPEAMSIAKRFIDALN